MSWLGALTHRTATVVGGCVHVRESGFVCTCKRVCVRAIYDNNI